ncbi:hypothetical protein [Tessaracoccus sp.]
MSSTQTLLLTLTAIMGAAIVVHHLTRRLRSWIPSSATMVILAAGGFYFAGGPAWLSKTLGNTLTPAATATKTHPVAAPKPARTAVHAAANTANPTSGSWAPSWLTLHGALIVLGVIVAAFILVAVAKSAASRREQTAQVASRREHDQELWDDLVTNDLETVRRWTAYQQDLALLLQYPMMQDRAEPVVVRAIAAMAASESLRTTTMPDLGKTPLPECAYARAVHAATTAFNIAEQHARRARLTGYDPSAQKKILAARQHLAVARGAAQPSDARQVANGHVRDLLDGLVVVPAGALP